MAPLPASETDHSPSPLTALKRPLEEELRDEETFVAVDGCEECCVKKRVDAVGTRPDVYIVATREGIVKRGMEEPASRRLKPSPTPS